MAPYQYIERPTPFLTKGGKSLPIFAVTPAHIETGAIDPLALDWAKKAGYKADVGSLLLIPTSDGQLGGALFGLGSAPGENPFLAGKLARALPAGDWHIETAPLTANRLVLGYGLGSYRFERYKADRSDHPKLLMPQDADASDIARQLAGVFLARDLINTPTNDMGPADLEKAFRALADHYKAEVSVVIGDELLHRNFPLVHTVGRASAQAPRLLEMRWGKKGHKKITLVGKGVCFDTGGLDIKPSSSMLLMKKDMGGAANVLGLALMIMDAKLKVDLRVIVPAVENSIAGNAFRPGDIYTSRQGLTVQIDNTDAEGRLILADALTYADEEEPDLLIDMATLTGAARVALGPDVPAFFSNDDALAYELTDSSLETDDPIWRLPLFPGYEKMVRSQIADLTNAPAGGMAGAITAALFLKRFVTRTTSWAHFDIFGWAPQERPHSPVGGEAQAIRALYRYIAALK
ncbi:MULTISPECIES: leucyl aminopeptidase family protein [Rhizobium/Agrobacterium group]|uniref:leucyl aminopeptidase family protein n=1 Tax=Rhizobium/Agrobacterium group TaxID=227290 RepID=UPI000B4035B6|nr:MULTISPECIES: M17 family metallopeptidase [Rhizobium/Agrobacterium group]MCF1447255.1 leucyl aminopeptidase family protein [Allorhizobium ampelinum]MCF1483187.1 leucyl aminopeptidase family protein [Allorhizobium ampelinum]NSZ41371.1 leucyl aminopeptidase family protein [Agrobacterium vitis]NTA25054.1 leucyl aminopeptidase family protein [Allorhizobium ampelinum]OVE97919.1 leucyl aminopeptidase [Allorhizobium ampelinum]